MKNSNVSETLERARNYISLLERSMDRSLDRDSEIYGDLKTQALEVSSALSHLKHKIG